MAALAATLVTSAIAVVGAAAYPSSYTTKVFMQGMTVPLSAGLHLAHDHNGDLAFVSGDGPNGSGFQVAFGLDAYLTDYMGKPLPHVGHSVSALLAGLRADKYLKVSAPVAVKVGGRSGKRIDVEVNGKGPKQDAGCPNVCESWLGFRRPKGGPGHFYDYQIGTGSTEPTRLYLVTLGSHVMGILFDAANDAAFVKGVSAADALVEALKLPSVVTPG